MPFPVYTTLELMARLDALNAAEFPPGVGDRALVRLFKNDVSPDANMTLDTFEEASFATYAAVPLIMLAPTLNDQGMVVSRSGVCNFTTLAGEPVQTIYGIFITDVDTTKVIAAQRFELPQVVGGVYPQAVSGVWRVSEPLSSYGWLDAE